MFLRDIFGMKRTTVSIHIIYKINLIMNFAWAQSGVKGCCPPQKKSSWGPL